MKILIITPYSSDPIHPRLEMLKQVLSKYHEVKIIVTKKDACLLSKINYFFLNFFDIYSIFRNKKEFKNHDLIFIQDMSLLPAAIFAKHQGKSVVYETLDNAVHLNYFKILHRFSWLKESALIPGCFEKLEKFLTHRFVDKIIVNSEALLDYFHHAAELIYYSSPYEGLQNNPNQDPALVYLGIFSEEKGAKKILEIQRKYNIPLFIFGEVIGPALENAIKENSFIKYERRLPSIILRGKLIEILKKYFLIGLSLIQSAHHSYKTQEANKDIDYLAMGIPLIGNHRGPTEQKILAGCGVLEEDEGKIQQLLRMHNVREGIAKSCFLLYNECYSMAIFEKKIFNLIQSLVLTNLFIEDGDLPLTYILNSIPKERSCVVLDAGCGSGKYLFKLSQLGYKNLYGVDLVEKLETFNKFIYQQATIENLPFSDHQFDFIISHSVIYYLKNPEKAIKEFQRVGKKGCAVMVTAHTKYSLFTLIRKIKILLKFNDILHLNNVHFQSAHYYQKLFQRNGFKVTLVDGYNYFSLSRNICNQFIRIVNKLLSKNFQKIQPKITKRKFLALLKSIFGYHFIIISKT